MALNNSSLIQKTNELWDKLQRDGVGDAYTAIEQISVLLFMKYLDEVSQDSNSNQSIFKGKFKPSPKADFIDKNHLRWSSFRMMGQKEMLDHVAGNVFPFIKSLTGFSFSKAIADTVFLISRPSLLNEAVRLIDDIYFTTDEVSDGHHNTIGDVYELLLRQVASYRDRISTPAHIIRLIIELLEPDYTDKICDPFCGTGRHLITAYRFVLSKHSPAAELLEDDDGFKDGKGIAFGDRNVREKLEGKTLSGFENNQTLVLAGIMNLMLHGIKDPQIKRMDILTQQYDEYEKPEQYTKIFATAPFKGSINESHRSKRLGSSSKVEVLFLERVVHMLKVGGTAGIVVSEGVLYGSSTTHREIRESLLQTCSLHAVIAMPRGVFNPYSTVASAILLFTKGKQRTAKAKPGTWQTQQVWFCNMTSDGYSLDDDRKLLHTKPLPEIVKLYSEYRSGQTKTEDRKGNHFAVPIGDLITSDLDLSIGRYQELTIEGIHQSPEEICQNLIKEEEHILEEMKALMSLINGNATQ